MGSDTAFVNAQLPAARVASKQLGIPVSVILAQWINETGGGSSEAFVQGNNYAGVSYLDPTEQAVGAEDVAGLYPILAYPTQAAGLAGYVNRWLEPIYAPTRAVWAKTTDPIAVAQSIEQSPWAAGHYGGHGLEDLITQNDLTAYDDPNLKPGSAAGALPGTGSTGGTQSATLAASLSDPFPGGSWDPLNIPFEIASGAEQNIESIVLTGAFVVAGLALIVGGFWRAAGTKVRASTQQAAAAAPVAAAAAV